MLASDSEPPEQNQFERLEEVVEEMSRQNLLTAGVLEVSGPASVQPPARGAAVAGLASVKSI